MSALCGLVALDGPLPAPERLERMAAALKYRGPDGQHFWTSGDAGLAHVAFATTPEAATERQPLLDAETGLVLVADVRLDNRAELIVNLTQSGHLRQPAPSDAELLLAAFKRWGEATPRELLGDFAFAVWNSRERRLFLARDVFGIRQLVYTVEGSTVLFATTAGAILAGLGSRPAANRRLLTSLVLGGFGCWMRETAWEGVRRVPPATSIRFREGGKNEETYWRLRPQEGSRSDDEWEEEFRTVFADAVLVRQRSHRPVGMVVSGGLDSSSVACVAYERRRSGAAASELRLYSVGCSRTPRADEREYQQAVYAACSGAPATQMPGDELLALTEFGRDCGFDLDEPEVDINRTLLTPLLRQAAADGCRVAFTGHGGDETLGGRPYFEPFVFADVSLGRVPAELGHFARGCRRPAWKILLYAYTRHVVPRGIVAAARKWGADAAARELDFATDVDFGRTDRHTLPNWTAQAIYDRVQRGYYQAHLQMLDRAIAHCGLEGRFPYLDRRVVECLLAIPPRLRFRDGWSKFIVRKAFGSLLPESVRDRKTHSEFSALIDRGLLEVHRARVEGLLRDPRAAEWGIVAESHIAQVWRTYSESRSPGARLALARILCVEEWLRSQEITPASV